MAVCILISVVLAFVYLINFLVKWFYNETTFNRTANSSLNIYKEENNYNNEKSYKILAVSPQSSLKEIWEVNPQSWLKRVPKVISLLPSLVYLLVVINDFNSLQVGTVVDYKRAIIGFTLSIVLMFFIFVIGCWCISKWYEIDELWMRFHKEAFVRQNKTNSFIRL